MKIKAIIYEVLLHPPSFLPLNILNIKSKLYTDLSNTYHDGKCRVQIVLKNHNKNQVFYSMSSARYLLIL